MHLISHALLHEGLVFRETGVVLHGWESETRKFGVVKRVVKG